MTQIVIVEKQGTLKSLNIKDYKEEELYKKCGFKKADGFEKKTEWTVKITGDNTYLISVFAKTEGKANTENKYDFPPPIDTTLFFGACAIVCSCKKEDKTFALYDLSLELWEKIYEKLFGGFEDLSATAVEDEEEEDELANVPEKFKTKQGYLKDGFVVDSDESEESYNSDDDDVDDADEDEDNDDDELNLEDIGSELAEEDYE
jgi:hypothetical protein